MSLAIYIPTCTLIHTPTHVETTTNIDITSNSALTRRGLPATISQQDEFSAQDVPADSSSPPPPAPRGEGGGEPQEEVHASDGTAAVVEVEEEEEELYAQDKHINQVAATNSSHLLFLALVLEFPPVPRPAAHPCGNCFSELCCLARCRKTNCCSRCWHLRACRTRSTTSPVALSYYSPLRPSRCLNLRASV
jgi:hypothetical protein